MEFFKLDDIIKIYEEDEDHRKCEKCNIVKVLESFNFSHNKHSGRSYTCKKCQQEHKRIKGCIRKIHPVPPPGHCPICSKFVDGTKKNKWNLDHCHETDEFKGYICRECNLGLGLFKDDPKIMIKAHEYLLSFLSKGFRNSNGLSDGNISTTSGSDLP
jgi:hypothetical protein